MPGQVLSTALVRYRLVDYSAPAVHAHKKVMVKGYVDRIEIVARHRRSHIRGDVIHDPLHYLSLLEKRPGALDQAPPHRDALQPAGQARIHPDAVLAGGLPGAAGDGSGAGRGGTSPDRLRCREAFPADRHRETARASRPGALPAPAPALRRHHPGPPIAPPCWPWLRRPHPARTSPESANLPAGIRETGAPVRGRRPGSSAVPGPDGGNGDDRSRAPHQAGPLPRRQTARERRLQGNPEPQQDAGAGSRARRWNRPSRERDPARPKRRRKTHVALASGWPPAGRASGCVSPPPPIWSTR